MDVITQLTSRWKDPRYYQIAVLSSLVIFGVVGLDFGIRWLNAFLIVTTAMAVQYLGGKLTGLSRFDPLSPLITSLSLTLLLRTDMPALAMLAACIAIGSKFLIRVNGKHVFNPANIAIVSLVLLSNHAWISSGQWGNAAIGAFALACLGFIVLTHARRAETTITFLIAYGALMFGRAIWLGDPLAIPLHAMKSGAFLIFAFFLISDPRTTPASRMGRIAFAALVAVGAFLIRFEFYQTNALLWSLVACALLVPLIDRLLPDERFEWGSHSKKNHHGGKTDVEKSDLGALLPGFGAAG